MDKEKWTATYISKYLAQFNPDDRETMRPIATVSAEEAYREDPYADPEEAADDEVDAMRD